MAVLLDTNVLLAAIVRNDLNHRAASEALRKLSKLMPQSEQIVAAPVLVELFYLIRNHVSYPVAIQALKNIRRQFRVEPLTESDQNRMEAIMQQYQSARFDYTDTAIMALAERLNVTQVYTFDRRDFVIIRPMHCAALELFP